MRKPNRYAGPIPTDQPIFYISPMTMPPSKPTIVRLDFTPGLRSLSSSEALALIDPFDALRTQQKVMRD